MLILEKLEFKKYLKELEYLKSDYDLKLEISKNADRLFIEEVNRVVNLNSELKSIYENKNNQEYKPVNIDNEFDEPDLDIDNKYLKKIYREIAKSTHPDVISNEKINNIYISATSYYDNYDIYGLFKICDILNIEYDFDIEQIKSEIEVIRNRIFFIENSNTWKWFFEKKEDIIIDYIRTKILK